MPIFNIPVKKTMTVLTTTQVEAENEDEALDKAIEFVSQDDDLYQWLRLDEPEYEVVEIK